MKLTPCQGIYLCLLVAPRAGAWIETGQAAEGDNEQRVAPRAGAWIETCTVPPRLRARACRPPRGGVD